MRKTFTCLLVVLTLAGCSATQNPPALADKITLARDEKTPYTIALAADAIPAEKTAAEQLQKYLQQVTGATFPILSEGDIDTDAPQILVGAGERVKTLLPQQDWAALGSDGIVIKTIGNSLVLAGGRPRGSLYAVFQFLEDEVGCRWWTPADSTIPSKRNLEVKPQSVAYTPPFSYRQHYTSSVREDPIFATIMRENGHHQRQTPEWGGHYNILGFVHTFSQLLPVEKYFKEHPEWYSDPGNGYKPATAASKMPEPQETDLCLSNPEVQKAVTREALAWIEKNPDAGYISISQNDNSKGYCRDDDAVKLIEEEGSPSAPLLKFVNSVADRIHEQYPNFLVETLAYHYSEEPPKTIRPAKNVIVRLAPISSDFGHPLNSDWNADTRKKVLSWSPISQQLFIWNYVTNFKANMLPHPNWDGLAKDLRFFADNKVIGVFEQGDNYTNGVGDFVQLRAWLMAKLMWNPNLDQDELIDEFLQGYYGAGAPYLRQYIDLIQKSFLVQNRKLSTFDADLSFFSLDVMNQSIGLFDQAAKAVKSDKVLAERIRRDRLSLELARLFRFNILKQTALRDKKVLLGDADPANAMRDLIATAKHFGIKDYSEGLKFETKIPALLAMFAPPVELPEFAKKFPRQDVIDVQSENFSLASQGKLSRIEPDANASSGKAASIVGNTNRWEVQVHLGAFLENTPKDKWHAYAMTRVDTKLDMAPNSTAFQSGIYDVTNHAGISSVKIPVDKVRGEKYQLIDLGSHQLHGGMYIWFAPMNDPVVEKVYIDRVILIRENQ